MLLIAANPDEEKDVWIRLDLSQILQPESRCRVSILFGEAQGDEAEFVENGINLSEHKWLIRRDKTSRGGLLVLKIEEIRKGQE